MSSKKEEPASSSDSDSDDGSSVIDDLVLVTAADGEKKNTTAEDGGGGSDSEKSSSSDKVDSEADTSSAKATPTTEKRRERNSRSLKKSETKSVTTEDEDEKSDNTWSEAAGGEETGPRRKVVRILLKGAKSLREIPGKKKIVAPYAVLSMEGQKETLRCKTPNTMMPLWNAKAQFIYGTEPTSENILKFQFFDAKGQTKDELLGQAEIEVAKLDWKKKRFELKDYKLTHPKTEVQGKMHCIILLTERVVAVPEPSPTAQKDQAKEEKKKQDAQKRMEEKAKKAEEKKKKEAEKQEKRKNTENGKGTLPKNAKPAEKHSIETKAGIAAPPDLLWNFMSNFHDVEEWLPKMPVEILPTEADGKLRRKIKYPDHDYMVEVLDEKDDPNMTLRWSSTVREGEKGLAGTLGYVVTLVIAPVGRTRSRLTWGIEYDVPPSADDSEAKRFFEKLVEIGMDGLKVAAEG